jgi:hypothetical protein
MKKRILLLAIVCIAFFSVNAQREVTGRVTDANGAPLVGVSVNIKGTSKGTATGPDGSFRLSAAPDNVIVFTIIGYADKEVTADNTSLTVVMEQSQRSLTEVVINGYAPQNKRQVAGSIAKLSGDEVKLTPIGSFDKALQGRVPGLLSQSQSGQPGACRCRDDSVVRDQSMEAILHYIS